MAPTCPKCNLIARLTNGAEVYPHRRDLHEKPIWKCDGCGGYVGCHPGTTQPLGTPADAELRKARMLLHEQMIDPIWKNAWRDPAYDRPDGTRPKRKTVSRIARTRVYEFLADRLGLTRDETHTGMFDLETCRRAWRALQGVTYSQIRDWARQRRKEAA